ncbi:MAG: ankyrin repeat domain-containing protein [Flammeovirgaceae bacterium]
MSAGDWKDMLKGVQENDLELVKYHINMGVDPNYQHPEFMTTPLIESAQYGHLEIAKYLLDHGANPHIKAGFSGDTALSVAKAYKQKAIIQLLKSHSK